MISRGSMFALATLALSLPATTASAETRFITLGTQGGPVTAAQRGQPSNLLTVNGVQTLIDVGDGTAQSLAKVGLQTARIDNVVITHLHFDHVGGLLALIGLRFQTSSPHPLQIYGPPGTKVLVDGLIQAMGPSMEVDYGVPGQVTTTRDQLVAAHEVKGGDTFQVGDVKVTAAQNTHYSFKSDSPEADAHQSLAFRFETPDRTIMVTGDTGPSGAVEELAKGADVLVGEMIDVPLVVALIKRIDPHIPEDRMRGMMFHLSHHHLTPDDLGAMAAKAGVKELVVTHLVPGGLMTEQEFKNYREDIAKRFSGKVTFASDMDKF